MQSGVHASQSAGHGQAHAHALEQVVLSLVALPAKTTALVTRTVAQMPKIIFFILKGFKICWTNGFLPGTTQIHMDLPLILKCYTLKVNQIQEGGNSRNNNLKAYD